MDSKRQLPVKGRCVFFFFREVIEVEDGVALVVRSGMHRNGGENVEMDKGGVQIK